MPVRAFNVFIVFIVLIVLIAAAALREAKLLRYSVEDLQKIVAEVFEEDFSSK